MGAKSCSRSANREKELESVTWTCLPSVCVLGAYHCQDDFLSEVSSLSHIYNYFPKLNWISWVVYLVQGLAGAYRGYSLPMVRTMVYMS